MRHLSRQHLSISVISQLLLAWFWPNFKGRFLGISRTESNCYGDICPGNICPGDICPYQEYLSCYWPNFNVSFLGPSLTDVNYHGDICPGNIWPGHICPYQQYLSCFWTNFDKTLNLCSLDHLKQIPTATVTFVLATFVHIRNISSVIDHILTRLLR